MKICHVISSVDRNHGGTTEYLRLTANELIKHTSNLVVSVKSPDPVDFDSEVEVVLLEKESTLKIFSSEIKKKLEDLKCDVFHGNGLWEKPVHLMSKVAVKRKIPYIISIHGMLEPWSLSQGKFKKQIALSLFQNKDLQKASCIHATAKEEAVNIRNLGFNNPIAIIPNGVNLKEFPEENLSLSDKKEGKKRLLFLSRIHQKKGIENLIDAWSRVDSILKENWIVEIVGNGDLDYIDTLKQKLKLNKLNKEIFIRKPAFGQEKYNYFKNADLFVLPTFSENFGIVVAEALASYTPVITTKGTPWEDLNSHNCGWWIDIGVNPLKNTIEKAIASDSLEQMALNGRKLVEEKYTLEVVAQKMTNLYSWVLNKIEKPNFIDIYNE